MKLKEYKNGIIIIAITLFIQAALYFSFKYIPANYIVMDSIMNFPLVKPFIYIYNSWYPFVILVLLLIYKYDKKTFYTAIVTIMLTVILTYITFLIYPTNIIRPEIEIHNITDWFIDFTYRNDSPAYNCLPSIHCLFCFVIGYFALKCKDLKKNLKILISIYFILIVLSTVLVKQHIIEDAIASLIYSIIGILIIYPNKEKICNKIHSILKFKKRAFDKAS